MSTFVLLTITGLGLGAMYFLVASGLSLIYGLIGVLNFAHGAFITFGAYAAWWLTTQISTSLEGELLAATAFGLAVGAALGALVELVFIRPLYRRPVEQVLVTVGLALVAGGARLRDLGRRSADLPGARLDVRHDHHPRREHPQ